MDNAIGNRIKVLMALNNISPDLMCKLSGLNKFQIDNILQGKSKKVDLLLRVAKVLNVSLDLICDIDKKPNTSDDKNLLRYELPLCIELFASKYSIKLTDQSKKQIISAVNKNYALNDSYKELIQRVHGILLLLKEHPDLIKNLNGKI